MRQLLNPYLNNFKLLILISCVITSCYSYNPIYNQPSKTSLNPKLGNYKISFESELNSELQYSKENLENFVLKDIHDNIITNVSDNKEAQSGNIYLTINYNYHDYSSSAHFMGFISFGIFHLIGFPRAGGALKVNGDVEIYDKNGDFVYYQKFKKQVDWTKTLYTTSHPSASRNGIDKGSLKTCITKQPMTFLWT